MKNRTLVFLISVGILSAGFLIYFLFRDDSILLNRWTHGLFNGPQLEAIRRYFQNLHLPHWFKYSLPDGLWMASLMIIILLIWDFKVHFRALTWMALAFASGVFIEAAQGIGWIPGTFDVMDLVWILIGGLFPISFIALKDHLCKTD